MSADHAEQLRKCDVNHFWGASLKFWSVCVCVCVCVFLLLFKYNSLNLGGGEWHVCIASWWVCFGH